MSAYFIGIIAILAGTLCHAGANILDTYFSAKLFKRLAILIFFSAFANFCFLPVIFLIELPKMPSLNSFILLFLVASINILYQYPYYKALQNTDTSIVSSLFSLAKIFTPLLAFLMVNEHLHTVQYVGFFIIIISSVFLTFDFKHFQFQSAFLLMLFVSFILTLQAVLFKKLYDNGMSWGTSVFWITVLDFGISIIFIAAPINYKELKTSFKIIKQAGGLLFLNQIFTWGGEVTGMYALVLIPVSVFEGISSVQPVFVLLLALLFVRKKPEMFNELIDKKNLWKKIVFFSLMIIGTLLIIQDS